ncbi:MAG: hypothetical protein AAGD35_12800 [Actinomycetota bacterium]
MPVRRLLPHAIVYLGVIAATLIALPIDSSFSSDAGAYAGQAYAIRHGGWSLDRPIPVVDSDNEGWLNGAVTPDGPIPYTTSPIYPVLLAGSAAAVHGPAEPDERAGSLALGFRVVPVSAAVAAAAMAWFLAARLRPGAEAPAFWLLALGPVLVNATTLWAHTLATAAGGLSILGLLSLIDHGRRVTDQLRVGPLVAGGGALTTAFVVAGLVRTEGLFWIAAVTATGVVAAPSLLRRAVVAGAGAVGVAAWFAHRLYGAALRADQLAIETRVGELAGGDQRWLTTRLSAAWLLLINDPSKGLASVATVVAVILVAAAVHHLLRGPDDDRRLAVLLWGAVAAYVVRLGVGLGEPISGMVGAWPLGLLLPVAVFGTIGAAGDGRRNPPLPGGRRLAAVGAPVVLTTGMVLATQYAGSGGLQWGGRYLSFVFVPLAAMAAIGAGRLLAERTLRAPIVALAVLPAVLGMAATVHLHRLQERMAVEALVDDPDVVITPSAPLPRSAWRALPTAFYRASDDDLAPLLAELADAEVVSVNVHGLRAVEIDEESGYRVAEMIGPVRRLELVATPTPSRVAHDGDP